MKFYSEITKQVYNTPEEVEKAEIMVKQAEEKERIRKEQEAKKQEELTRQRKSRAAAVEEARKKMAEAQAKYREELESFIKDYGSYHYTSTSAKDIPLLFDLFDLL